jgi:hypothetical protein
MVPVNWEQIEFYLNRGRIKTTWREMGDVDLRVRSWVSVADEANFYLNETLSRRSTIRGVRLRESTIGALGMTLEAADRDD